MVSHEAVVKMSSGAVLSEGPNGEGGAASKMVHSGPLTGSSVPCWLLVGYFSSWPCGPLLTAT